MFIVVGKSFVIKNMNKALIIGCGKIAGNGNMDELETHGGAMSSNPNISVKACVDKDIDQATAFAKKISCDAYYDLAIALKKFNYDIVSVCTPDLTHYSITKEILLTNSPPKVIFLEKPACRLRSEYIELVELSKKKQVQIVVNHTRRFSRKYMKIRDFINTGKLGGLKKINVVYYGGWFHNGSHVIDTLFLLFGKNIIWQKVYDPVYSRHKDDPTLQISGRLGETNTPVMLAAIDENYFQLFEVDAWFERGRLKLEDFGYSVDIKESIENKNSEKVLSPIKFKVPTEKNTEMQIAIGLICDYIKHGNVKSLEDVKLESIGKTIDCLWSGKELFDKRKVQ